MSKYSSEASSSIEYIEKRLCQPIDLSQRPIGLTNVVGTHGCDVESVARLALTGEFSRSEEIGIPKFYATFNPSYKGWPKTKFAEDATEIIEQTGLFNPVEVSIGYAESTLSRFEGDDDGNEGFVITLGPSILPLIERVLEEGDEPELELSEAPRLTSVNKFHPTSQLALDEYRQAIKGIK